MRFLTVAEHREKNKFPGLECFVIDVISDMDTDVGTEDMAQYKMSSTAIRRWIVESSAPDAGRS